jgi:periplasmic protein TonB
MLNGTQPGGSAFRNNRNAATCSIAIHIAAILAIAVALHAHTTIAPYRLPGSTQGVQFLTYYSPGSVSRTQNELSAKTVQKQTAAISLKPKPVEPKAEPIVAPSSERGIGGAGQSGLGQGNITIALEKFFPYPKPSLDTLPKGAAGDVILNAIIDEHGKISQLTLVKGLGPDIDNAVIATVNQWVYTPAMKDGVPVPSVEELHFHYERRS